MAAAEGGSSGGLWRGLVRALATMLGVHLQYAQREAASDMSRLLGGVVWLVLGTLLLGCGLLLSHQALIAYLTEVQKLARLEALLAVAGGDLLLGLLLVVVGRLRLRRPIMSETRSLVRQTVSSLAETAAGD